MGFVSLQQKRQKRLRHINLAVQVVIQHHLDFVKFQVIKLNEGMDDACIVNQAVYSTMDIDHALR